MTEEQYKIIETLNGIREQLIAEGGQTEDGSGYLSYNVAEGSVMIAEAIDRNTAAIVALIPELKALTAALTADQQ